MTSSEVDVETEAEAPVVNKSGYYDIFNVVNFLQFSRFALEFVPGRLQFSYRLAIFISVYNSLVTTPALLMWLCRDSMSL